MSGRVGAIPITQNRQPLNIKAIRDVRFIDNSAEVVVKLVEEGDRYYLIRVDGRKYNQYVRKSDIINGEVDITPCYDQRWGKIADYYGGLPGLGRRR